MNLIKEFADLVKQTGGYASHQTALYFLGQQTQMPEELSIVCRKRLADKVVCGKKIRIYFVVGVSCKRTEICRIEDAEIKVSTIEQTLVDLVGLRAGGLTYLELGKYFLTLAYDLKQLIEAAVSDGDSCLKRTLFYTSWTGRATWKDFPGVLQRTPVKLYAKLNNDVSFWNRHLFIRFPKNALEEFPDGDLPLLPAPVCKRIELARYRPFRRYFADLKILPVFDLPDLSVHFSRFFKMFLGSLKNDPVPLFVQMAKNEGDYPQMIVNWVERQAEKKKLPDWFTAGAGEWIKMNLECKTLENAIQAVELAIRIKLHAIVLPHLNYINQLFSESRRFELINNLCETAWKNGELKTLDEYLIYLSAQITIHKAHDTLEIIADARRRFTRIPAASAAGLSYYAAIAFLAMHKFEESILETEACKSLYEKCPESCKDSQKLVGLEFVASHNFVVQGQLMKARSCVLNAYRIAKSKKIGKTMVVATLSNLTQIEYICGHFQTSIKFARQTLRKIPAEGIANRYPFIRMLLSAYIGIGDFYRAIMYGKKLLLIGQKIGSESRIQIAQLLLAHLYELYGQPAAAARTWKIWDEDSIAGQFPYLFPTFIQVKVTRLVFQGAVEEALLFLEKVTAKMTGASENSEPRQFLLHQLLMLGLLMFKTNRPDALSVFENARTIANNLDDCYEKSLLAVVMGSLFPRLISGGEITRKVEMLVNENAYDPFWFLYAAELLQRELPECKMYLQAHVEKTHEILLDHLFSLFPFLRKIVAKFLRNDKERKVRLIQSGNSRQISLKEFNELRPEQNIFFFDVVSGNWSLNKRNGNIKPITNAHKIFSALLVVKGNQVCLSELYQSVWGGQFDPEIDKPAVMTALNRCRKMLRDISPAIHLDWSSEKKSEMQITLKILVPWAVTL